MLVPALAQGTGLETLLLMQAAVEFSKQTRLCVRGDCIVALHRIGNASVIKIVDIK